MNRHMTSADAVPTPAAAARLLDAALAGDEAQSDGCPHQIGQYTIDSVIGRGASGFVYRAYGRGSDLPVAIKVLSPLLSSDARARAFREIDALAALRLNCVPRLLDRGLSDGAPYLVTELIDGRPLDEYVSPLSRREKVAVLARVGDAVQLLHEHGLIHRDLKPANILIDRRNNPVILDLGLACTESAHSITDHGAAVGTIAFMSPEQARGDQAALSTRADIYSLGAIAYLILLGHTPFDTSGPLRDALIRACVQAPRTPRELDPACPKPLAAVLSKACASDARARFHSAGEFAADLRRWLEGGPVMAAGPGVAARLAWKIACSLRKPSVLVPALVIGVAAVTTPLISLRIAGAPRYFVHSHQTNGIYTESAILMSATGKPLALIGGGAQVGVAQLVRGHEGRDLAVIASIAGTAPPSGICTDGDLWIANPRNIARPLRVQPGLSPPPRITDRTTAGPGANTFSVVDGLVADILPANNGPEVAVTHISDEGIACIRIYSLDLKVLREYWHQGSIYTLAWWPEQRLLVGAGDWHGAGKFEREAIDSSDLPLYTHALFALRPEPDVVPGWLRPDVEGGAQDPIAWYRVLAPAGEAEGYQMFVINHALKHDDDGIQVCFYKNPLADSRAFNCRVSPRGQLLLNSLIVSDMFCALFPSRTEAEAAASRLTLVPVPHSQSSTPR